MTGKEGSLKNNSAFVWTLKRPVYVIVISYIYWIFFLIPSDFIEEIKKIAKRIKELWKEGLNTATLLAFSALVGAGLSFWFDKTPHGWKLRTPETLLFIGGAFFWLVVFVFTIEYSRDLWKWTKRKMDR